MLYGVREADAALFAAVDSPLSQRLQTELKPSYGGRAEVREAEHLLPLLPTRLTRYCWACSAAWASAKRPVTSPRGAR